MDAHILSYTRKVPRPAQIGSPPRSRCPHKSVHNPSAHLLLAEHSGVPTSTTISRHYFFKISRLSHMSIELDATRSCACTRWHTSIERVDRVEYSTKCNAPGFTLLVCSSFGSAPVLVYSRQNLFQNLTTTILAVQSRILWGSGSGRVFERV